jgi:hypothetical protein
MATSAVAMISCWPVLSSDSVLWLFSWRGAALQVLVVAPGLEVLVVEVLDGLVVQQRVDGARMRRRVELVHLALAELRAPLGHATVKLM